MLLELETLAASASALMTIAWPQSVHLQRESISAATEASCKTQGNAHCAWWHFGDELRQAAASQDAGDFVKSQVCSFRVLRHQLAD